MGSAGSPESAGEFLLVFLWEDPALLRGCFLLAELFSDGWVEGEAFLSVDFELRPFFAGGADGGDAFGGNCFGLATLFFFFGGVGDGGDVFGGYYFGVTFLFSFFGGVGEAGDAFGGYCFGVVALFCLAEVFF